MYVRRDYRNRRFLSEKNRRTPIFRRFAFALLLILIIGAIGLWQQATVINTTYELFGPELSPTPYPAQVAREAQDLFWAGDLDGSLLIWDRVLAMRPDSVDYLYEYGMILIDLSDERNGYAERAETLAMQILELDANDVRGYALRARALVWQGNSSLAITVAQAGTAVDADFAPLYAALSRAYIGEGDLRDGQVAGEQAITYGPDDVRSYWAYASSLAFSGARDAAIAEYERALRVNPNFLPPYFELALLYVASNRDEQALDTYARILGVQPSNARALLRRCQVYLKVGRENQARGSCEDAVVADNTYVPALFQLGLFRYSANNYTAADDLFQTCLELAPNSLECTYYSGLTHYYLAKSEYDQQCVPNRLSATECQARAMCQVGWDLLQEALIMAETRPDTGADRETISIGLSAIQSDLACAGVSGRNNALPTTATPTNPTPTATPDGA